MGGLLRKKVKFVLKKTRVAIFAVVLFHEATWLNYYLSNNFFNYSFPSQERLLFERAYGTSLEAWRSDIEQNPHTLTVLSEVLEKEQQEHSFPLEEIVLVSKNYLKQSFPQQFNTVIDDAVGTYFKKRISLRLSVCDEKFYLETNDHPLKTILQHEVKHAKTFAITDIKFYARWKALCRNQEKHSLYTDDATPEVNWRDIPFEQSVQLGFVSSYARKNVYEDIAETGEFAENILTSREDGSYPGLELMIEWLYTRKSPVIAGKIALAQEYNIIPKEFSEFVWVQKLYHDAKAHDSYIDTSKVTSFLEQSERFLQKHPNSVYNIYVHNARGGVFAAQGIRDNEKASFRIALEEWNKGLLSPYKDIDEYRDILHNMQGCYRWRMNEPCIASVYTDAIKEFEHRYLTGDVFLAKRGVNDLLYRCDVLR